MSNKVLDRELQYEETSAFDDSAYTDSVCAVKDRKVLDFTKRVFDIFFACVAFVLLGPVVVLFAILIKAEDKGPVFYKHERVGKNGKIIHIYKFRSMKVNADKLEDVLSPEDLDQYYKEFKIDNDPRITKIGGFLRKTSLDELPQIANIFKGELSLVGPRPLVYKETFLYGKARATLLSVKPGLTGYWQAYARNTASYSSGKRQNMELYYVHNRSFWLDIKVFFKTFQAIITKTGAQ